MSFEEGEEGEKKKGKKGTVWFLPPCREERDSLVLTFSAQELGQAFGLYPGVFDPLDFLFNAGGKGLAVSLDLFRSKKAG